MMAYTEHPVGEKLGAFQIHFESLSSLYNRTTAGVIKKSEKDGHFIRNTLIQSLRLLHRPTYE